MLRIKQRLAQSSYEGATNKDLANARMNDPSGHFCGWCGTINCFADDCGFFYITPYKNDTRPCCKSCYEGFLGQQHRNKYGVGER